MQLLRLKQIAGAVHSAVVTQVALHGTQRALVQKWAGPQSLSAAHDGGTHPPRPSQAVPFGHRPIGSGAPAGTGMHVRRAPGTLHA